LAAFSREARARVTRHVAAATPMATAMAALFDASALERGQDAGSRPTTGSEPERRFEREWSPAIES
jgi:hypothetical protein